MKRLLYVLTLSLLFVVLTGCAKDEVTPHTVEDNNETAEVASQEDVKQDDKQDTDKSADKEENEADTAQSNKKAAADKAGDTDKEEKLASEKSNESSKTKKSSNTSNKADTSKNSSKDTTKRGSGKQTKQTAEKSKASPKKDTSKPGKPKTGQTNKKKDEQSSTKPVGKPVEKPKEETNKPEKTVTISITTGDVKGTILPPTKVALQDGDTVLEPTLRILKEKGIQISVRGSKSSAYVEGIDNLYEFDEGQNSGWMITVDGVLIDRSAGAYSVSNGQTIRWGYTRDYIQNPLGGK